MHFSMGNSSRDIFRPVPFFFWNFFFIYNNGIEIQKYRNTLKGKENKKKMKITYINIRNTNLQYHCLQFTLLA